METLWFHITFLLSWLYRPDTQCHVHASLHTESLLWPPEMLPGVSQSPFQSPLPVALCVSLNFGGHQHLHLVTGVRQRNNPLFLFFWNQGGRFVLIFHQVLLELPPTCTPQTFGLRLNWDGYIFLHVGSGSPIPPFLNLVSSFPLTTLLWFSSPFILFPFHFWTSSTLTGASLTPLN